MKQKIQLWKALCLLCWSAVAAVPFLVKYWPGYYGMNHAAVVHILRSLATPDSPYLGYLHATGGWRPYQAQYYLLSVLSYFMTLHSADKVLLAAFFVGVPAALLFVIGRIAPARWPNAGLVAPFSSCFLVAAGNVATTAGMLLGMVTIGLVWGRRGGRPEAGEVEPASWPAVCGGAVVLYLATFLHPFSMMLTALVLGLLEGRALLHPRVLARYAVVFLPSLGFAIGTRGTHTIASLVDDQTVQASMDMLINTSFWMIVLGGYHPLENYVRLIALGLLLCGAWQVLRRGPLNAPGRDARLVRVLVVLVGILLVFPVTLKGAGLQYRFAFALPLLAALVADPLRGWSARRTAVVAALGVAASLALVPLLYRGQSSFTQRVEDATAVAHEIPRGARVLPIRFPGKGQPAQEWLYGAMERDFITPYYLADGSYYAGAGYRPLSYTQTIGNSFLPALNPWQQFENVCRNLAGPEPCKPWQKLRDAEYLVMGRTYDAVMLLNPSPALVALFQGEYVLLAQKGTVWAFKPKALRQASVHPERAIDVCITPADAD